MPEDLELGSLNWGFAETSAEREEVYLFRYAHYYRNLPAAPEVDHKAKRVHLPLDDVSSHLTGRDANGKLIIVGSGTRASTAGIPSEWREIFRLDTLKALDLDRILIFARLVEHEACRGSLVFPVFFRLAAAYFVERGYAYSIHYCAPSLVPLYERVGYRIYGPGYTMRSGLFRVPMILAAADAAYLAGVNPSFAKAVEGASADLEKFRAVLPETQQAPLSAMTGEKRLATIRAALAPNLPPKDAVEERVPDAAVKPLRRASLLALSPGDSPAHPTDQPLVWFILEGEMVLQLHDGSKKRAFPGTFVNGYALSSYSALHTGKVVAFAPCKAPETGQAILPADFWLSLA